MASESDYEPPSRDDDAVTYLPIDKLQAARVGFGPTDLRAAQPTGGIRLGKSFVFLLDEAMPPLKAEQVSLACDNIIRGHEVYASLVYLSRAQPRDVPQVLDASTSYEIKTRWERLWVLCATLGRLARRPEGQEALVAAFKEDLAGLHLVSKFTDQNNPAVKRLFARLKPTLLPMLLDKLSSHLEDPRRGALLCGIIAQLETDATVLKSFMPKEIRSDAVERLLQMLYTVSVKSAAKTLSSATLKERLRSWRQGS